MGNDKLRFDFISRGDGRHHEKVVIEIVKKKELCDWNHCLLDQWGRFVFFKIMLRFIIMLVS